MTVTFKHDASRALRRSGTSSSRAATPTDVPEETTSLAALLATRLPYLHRRGAAREVPMRRPVRLETFIGGRRGRTGEAAPHFLGTHECRQRGGGLR